MSEETEDAEEMADNFNSKKKQQHKEWEERGEHGEALVVEQLEKHAASECWRVIEKNAGQGETGIDLIL